MDAFTLAASASISTVLHEPLVGLFIIIAAGYLLGRISVAGLSLGSSGVIFVALAMGHFKFTVPEGVGTLGMVLFVYCLGLSAGPSFFRVFKTHAKALAVVGAVIVATGMLATWGIAKLFTIPPDLASGIFAGALTSTPALAAATESLPGESNVAVGFGVAYPFGVVGVVLFVQLLPRLVRKTMAQLERETDHKGEEEHNIVRVLVEVENPAVAGKRLSAVAGIADSGCQVPRVLIDDRLRPIPADFTLQVGQHVFVVGEERNVEQVIELLGKRSDHTGYTFDAEQQRMKIVATSKGIVDRTLRELKLLSHFGVTVARVNRHDVEFVPRSTNYVRFADALTVVGEPENLQRFAAFAGHRARSFDETDLISLAIGVVVGVLLGKVEISIGGTSMSLGLAGGPMFVGLLLGHFGRIGPIVGHLPRASRLLLSELGLVFFLASAGVAAGAKLLPVLREHGLSLVLGGAIVTLAPMIVGCIVAHLAFRLNLLQTLGAICGGMTSTPGVGAISSRTDSQIPVVSYAAVYPLALILMTILAPLLVAALS